MKTKELASLRAMLAEFSKNAGTTIADQRAAYSGVKSLFPSPPNVDVMSSRLGGVRGEWLIPPDSGEDAALLYFHGGGYVIGSLDSHRHLVTAIAREAGLRVFNADYRLAPEAPFPAAVEDGVAAYRGLLEIGIKPERIIVSGDSAGGGLTVATLLAARDQGLPMPAGAIPISPWVDLTGTSESLVSRASRDPMVTKENIIELSGTYLAGKDPKTPLASPIFADLKGLPPLLILVGTEETLYDDAATLYARADAAGVPTSFEVWSQMVHVWPWFHPMLTDGRNAITRMALFIRTQID